ncbi:ribosome biogenesis domain-containing protein [Chlamydiota bacterium]
MFPPTIVIRHRKENLKKCSLRGLETRSDFLFFRYPLHEGLPALENYILLSLDTTEELSAEDGSAGLLVLDATWRYAQKMEQQMILPREIRKRRLPANLQTAYPRRQQDCLDPTQGLASIEAIACAYALMGRSLEGLFDHYHWKESFIEKNKCFLLNYTQ